MENKKVHHYLIIHEKVIYYVQMGIFALFLLSYNKHGCWLSSYKQQYSAWRLKRATQYRPPLLRFI